MNLQRFWLTVLVTSIFPVCDWLDPLLWGLWWDNQSLQDWVEECHVLHGQIGKRDNDETRVFLSSPDVFNIWARQELCAGPTSYFPLPLNDTSQGLSLSLSPLKALLSNPLDPASDVHSYVWSALALFPNSYSSACLSLKTFPSNLLGPGSPLFLL